MKSNLVVNQKNDNHSYKVPFSSETYVWGKGINQLHLDDYLQDTIMYGNRYSSEAFKLLSNFSLGLLSTDYEKATKSILEVAVVVGLPTEDWANRAQDEQVIKGLKGQHQVEIDGKTYTIRVNRVYILPQPMGTLYNELLDEEGYLAKDNLVQEKVGVVDIGGGTVLIDTILDFKLSKKNRKQYNTGINDLYEAIQSRMQGSVSLYQLERTLRNPEEGRYVYEFNKHNRVDITELVKAEVDRFTSRLITNIKSTLKNLDSIDSLIFTGGGANLVNKKLLEKEFKNSLIVENTETANVNGFYKYGLSVEEDDEKSVGLTLFALDLGNKQTKLKNEFSEQVLPSQFLNAADMPVEI